MDLLYLAGVVHYQPRSFVAVGLSLLDKLRVHFGELVMFAAYRFFQVIRSCADSGQGLKMVAGVNGLGFGDSAEKPGDLRLTVLLGSFSEKEVFTVCLALAGKGRSEVVLCVCHFISPRFYLMAFSAILR
jgi:hypothetical protein